jgi:hypothetical protein
MVRAFHGWYMKACSRGIQFIQAKVPQKHFNCDPYNLPMLFEDIHTLYRFKRMTTTLITIW